MELTACRSRLERALQKPKDRRRDGCPVAPDLAFERVARPEVTSTRYHEPAYIDADLVEGVLERLRLGGRIDHVVGCVTVPCRMPAIPPSQLAARWSVTVGSGCASPTASERKWKRTVVGECRYMAWHRFGEFVRRPLVG
jgi:hypothetical protein